MIGWQPIETAPKNGVEVLVYKGTYFDGSFLNQPGLQHEFYVAAWVEMNRDGEWRTLDTYRIDPTHWQPLPEPPK